MPRYLRLAVATLLIGACGRPADDGGSAPETAPETAAGNAAPKMAEGAAAAASNPAALSLTCAAPFTPNATAATLSAAFGAQNVIPETIDGPEGEKINVTAIYPSDPARRIEVYFKDEEARTGLVSATVKDDVSVWTGPAGVRMGDGVEKVEAANGGAFLLMGFDWDYGGYVNDWKGGTLNEIAPGCHTIIRFRRDEASQDLSIAGDVPLASDLPAVRAAKPTVVEFGISW